MLHQKRSPEEQQKAEKDKTISTLEKIISVDFESNPDLLRKHASQGELENLVGILPEGKAKAILRQELGKRWMSSTGQTSGDEEPRSSAPPSVPKANPVFVGVTPGQSTSFVKGGLTTGVTAATGLTPTWTATGLGGAWHPLPPPRVIPPPTQVLTGYTPGQTLTAQLGNTVERLNAAGDEARKKLDALPIEQEVKAVEQLTTDIKKATDKAVAVASGAYGYRKDGEPRKIPKSEKELWKDENKEILKNKKATEVNELWNKVKQARQDALLTAKNERLMQKIDLNACDVKSLEDIDGLRAQQRIDIIALRTTLPNQKFEKLSQIRAVKGIGEKTMTLLRQWTKTLPGDESGPTVSRHPVLVGEHVCHLKNLVQSEESKVPFGFLSTEPIKEPTIFKKVTQQVQLRNLICLARERRKPGTIWYDTGCRRCVAGPDEHKRMRDFLRTLGLQPVKREIFEEFVFGDGEVDRATVAWIYPVFFDGKFVGVLDIAECTVPCPTSVFAQYG